MNETKFDKASKKHMIIAVLGITAVALLMLVNIASAAQSSDAWLKKGIALEILKKHDEAIKACDKAIEVNPQNSNAWNNKGFALDHLNKPDEAIKAYEKAIEVNPQNSNAWNNKGFALSSLGKYDEAIEAFDKAIEINSQIRSLEQ